MKKKDLKLFVLFQTSQDTRAPEVEIAKLIWAKDANEIMKGAIKEYVKNFFDAHPDPKDVRAEEETWWKDVERLKGKPETLHVEDSSFITHIYVRELETVPPPVEEVQTID